MASADRFAALRGGPVVVSGGAGGIGSAIVAALLDEGLTVASLDLRDSEQATCSVACDVTDEAAVLAAVDDLIAAVGVPTALVCAAGVVSEGPYTELEAAEWRRVVDASLTSGFLLTKAIVPQLASSVGGPVVTMSSGFASKGMLHGPHYAAAKAGVEGLTKSLALEYGPAGVRVNAVAPGPIRTAMLDTKPDWDEHAVARGIPLGRIGEPDDIVGPVLFLLGDESRYMTGQVLQVSGGMLMA